MANPLEKSNIETVGQEALPQNQKILPHNLEAEMALLGTLMANNKTYESVSEIIQPEYFIDPVHTKIYRVFQQFMERGQLANPITIAHFLEKDDQLKDVGGKEYLARLATNVTSFVSVRDYANIIFDTYLRREIINVNQESEKQAYDFDMEYSAVRQIEELEQKLFRLAEAGTAEGGFSPLSAAVSTAVEMAEAAYKKEGNINGVTSGLKSVDKKLGGFHPSDLIILAGRPSMGKTALATKFALEAAMAFKEEGDEHGNKKLVDGARVAFFSLEMSAEQLAGRLLADQTKISSEKIRRGELNGDDFDRFVEASRFLSELPLYIDDTPGLTVSALRNRARRLKRQKGLDFIIVDYLQLIQAPGRASMENRVQAVSEITRGLKILAKELNVPIIALSQLSRGPEQREDKRPQLADLRESGSIEQDADVVMFIFREEYYLAREQPSEGTEKHAAWMAQMERVHNVAEVIVAKHRHGAIGTAKVYFDGAHTTFADLQPEDTLSHQY